MTNPFAPQGGSAVSWKDATPGTTVGGTVSAPPSMRQATQFGTQQPEYWPDGRPKMDILVEFTDDQGDERTFWMPLPSNMQHAIVKALADAGEEEVKVGGTLRVTFTGMVTTEKGFTARAFTATYKAPGGNPFGADSVAPTAPPAAATAVPRLPATAAMQVAAFIQAGMTNEQILGVPTMVSLNVTPAQIELVRSQGPV